MRYLLVLILTLTFSITTAQSRQSFTRYLQTQVAGQGSVTIIEDEEIDALVNNQPIEVAPVEPSAATTKTKDTAKHRDTTSRTAATTPTKQADTTITSHTPTTKYTGTRTRYKTRGYRIQVYSNAGNSAAKQEAKAMEAKVRKAFPELSVYCHFKSPRWICRVGDFSTREEAQRYLTKIRSQKISVEATIVSDDVLVVQ